MLMDINHGGPIESHVTPDFNRGAWKTNPKFELCWQWG